MVAVRSLHLHKVLDFAIRVGELMLASGASAADVTDAMLRITRAADVRNVAADVMFNQITLSYLPDDESIPFTRFRALTHRQQNFAVLDASERLVADFCDGRLELLPARARMREIIRGVDAYPRWLATCGWAAMAAGGAIGLGGGWLVTAMALLSTLLISVVSDLFGRQGVPVFYTQIMGGFVATLGAVVVWHLDPAVNSSVVVVACLIYLLAGVISIGAMQDAITGWYVTASGRVLEVAMLTIGLIAGVQGGLLFARLLEADVRVTADLPVTLTSTLLLAVAGALLAIGFAVGAQAPPRTILGVTVLAVFVSVAYGGLGATTVPVNFSAGILATIVGLVSVLFAQRRRAPALLFVVIGVIPMVPGSRIYGSMLAMADEFSLGAELMLSAAGTALALAAGAVLGQYLGVRLLRRVRPLRRQWVPVLTTPFSTSRRRRTLVTRQTGVLPVVEVDQATLDALDLPDR